MLTQTRRGIGSVTLPRMGPSGVSMSSLYQSQAIGVPFPLTITQPLICFEWSRL